MPASLSGPSSGEASLAARNRDRKNPKCDNAHGETLYPVK